MRRYLLMIFVVILSAAGLHAQSQKDAMDRIRNDHNGRYKYGEGRGLTEEEARNKALTDLLSKLSTTHDYGNSIHEAQINDDYELNQQLKVQSTWRGTLEDCEIIIYQEKNKEWVCMQYITTESLQRIKEQRKELIDELVNLGMEQEKALNISSAMKYYMWALNMLGFYGEKQKIEVEGHKYDASGWLKMHIPAMLQKIDITLANKEIEYDPTDYDHYTVNLNVKYNNEAVSGLELLYFNGERQVGPVYVKNGEAALKFPKLEGITSIDVKIIYDSKKEALLYDKELAAAYGNGGAYRFDEASYVRLPIKINKTKIVQKGVPQHAIPQNIPEMALDIEGDVNPVAASSAKEEIMADAATIESAGQVLSQAMRKTIARPVMEHSEAYVTAMQRVEQSMRTRKYDDVKELFTEEGYKIFMLMMRSGEVRVSKTPDKYEVECSQLFTIGKRIPVTIKTGRHISNENVVFRFDSETGKIKSVAYALTQRAENDIFRQAQWNMESRYSLLNFMEDYQTAFALKRADYIEKIFSDNAIIIVGSVSNKATKKFYDGTGMSIKQNVRYTTYTKDEYLRKVKRDFANKSFINLTFEDAQISKMATDDFLDNEVLWIELKQQYTSSNYSDKGFLALQINMKPSGSYINVRTWTPSFVPLDELKRRFPIGF